MWRWVYCTMGQTTHSSMVHKEQFNSKLAWKLLLFIHWTHQSEVGTLLSCMKLKLHVPETVTFLSGVKSIYPAGTSRIRVTIQTYSQQWSHSFLTCGLISICPLYAVSYSKPPKLCVYFFHILYWYCYIYINAVWSSSKAYESRVQKEAYYSQQHSSLISQTYLS